MKTEGKYDILKLENQLCFPLYAASREVIKQYKPYLDKIDLTYTQYVAMLLLWENKTMTVKELGEHLYLDSGTLTPLLKKLEAKGFISRVRSTADERNLNINLTAEGEKLREKALEIPHCVHRGTTLNEEELENLYRTLYKIIEKSAK
ncbi:MAG: MarR family transcriptional regulator [Oscillospiraceae bacterium]|nr:MarR family transcriptional regulator [Oscillospiraceae bacterium]